MKAYRHYYLLGNDERGAVDSLNIVGNELPLKWRSWWERSNFSLNNIWMWEKLQTKPEDSLMHLKAHKLINNCGLLSFIVFAVRRPIEPKCSQICYFMHDTNWNKWSLTIPNVSSALNLQPVCTNNHSNSWLDCVNTFAWMSWQTI